MPAWATRLIDERVDAVAAVARQTFLARVAIACICVPLLAINLDPIWAAAWFAGFVASEVWTWAGCRPVALGRTPTRAERLYYLASALSSSTAWAALALLYWTGGTEAFRMVAVAVLAGILIHAQCFAFRSPPALLVLAGPAAVLWTVLPTLYGGFSGTSLLTVAVSLVLLLVYIAVSAASNMRAAEALESAKREAEAANRAKSSFLAMMSHELRTPMNGVLGMAHALRLTKLDAQQAEHVDMLVRSGDGLMAILNDILDISKIEAGRLELEAAPFDLAEKCRSLAHLWSQAAAEKGVRLTYDLASDLPVWVLGDAMRVRQILMNLLSNAVKFTDSGEIRLSLRPAPSADGDGGVEVTVADSGIGMTEGQVKRLFRPFAQAEASTARRFGGTGLGLAICRQLAEMMGGSIQVTSAPGEGSTFRVWLPLPYADPQEPAGAAQAEGGLEGVRILVAEDNPINQAVARTLLEAMGAAIAIAADGAEALERLAAEPFDLVLMDVHMPVMDGIEALQRIRDGQAGDPTIPVIALTADAMAGEEARLVGLGFDALEPKPIRPAALIQAILRACQRRIEAAGAEAGAA